MKKEKGDGRTEGWNGGRKVGMMEGLNAIKKE